jgi:hypothetical protein
LAFIADIDFKDGANLLRLLVDEESRYFAKFNSAPKMFMVFYLVNHKLVLRVAAVKVIVVLVVVLEPSEFLSQVTQGPSQAYRAVGTQRNLTVLALH